MRAGISRTVPVAVTVWKFETTTPFSLSSRVFLTIGIRFSWAETGPTPEAQATPSTAWFQRASVASSCLQSCWWKHKRTRYESILSFPPFLKQFSNSPRSTVWTNGVSNCLSKAYLISLRKNKNIRAFSSCRTWLDNPVILWALILFSPSTLRLSGSQKHQISRYLSCWCLSRGSAKILVHLWTWKYVIYPCRA